VKLYVLHGEHGAPTASVKEIPVVRTLSAFGFGNVGLLSLPSREGYKVVNLERIAFQRSPGVLGGRRARVHDHIEENSTNTCEHLELLDLVLPESGAFLNICFSFYSVLQGLIKWSGMPASLATWEDLEALRQRFPLAPTWGQVGSQEEGECQQLRPTGDRPKNQAAQ